MKTLATVDWTAVRADFPLLRHEIDGAPIVYLDSSNTSQKPRQVIDAIDEFTRFGYGPINRSAYRLAAEATDRYEGARAAVARFVNAPSPDEIVFTKNATEALNLFASSWGSANLGPGDAVLLTHLEHHANIVPWQMLAARLGFEIRWVPLTDDGRLDLTDLDQLLDGVKAFSFTAASNVLGTLPPVTDLVRRAHAAGAIAIVDACQFVPHQPTDVQEWDADAIAFSSHKMVGPSGIGALWARREILESIPPFLGGGNMIADVRIDGFVPAKIPAKFEAGTPPIIEAIGFGAAVEYLEGVGMAAIRDHERDLTRYTLDALTAKYGDDIVIHGPRDIEVRGGVFSFAFRDVHPHDLSQVLDQRNVCVRAGHHCAKPLMRLMGVNATARASVYLYNDRSDIDALVDALDGVTDIFGF